MNVTRKEAVAAYKKRVAPYGIYAVRCPAVGKVWVGRATDLDAIWNRIRFSLEKGLSTNREMQTAWSAQGGETFLFEILEALPEEDIAYVRSKLMADRLAVWRKALNASAA